MATIDWGNTRAPMHPQQSGFPQATSPQSEHAQFGAPPAYAHHGAHHGAYQHQDHYQAAAYGQPHQNAHYAPQGGGHTPAASGNGAGRFGAAVHYAGAAVSLALIAGLAVWGYQLAMRDVTGIPVVRALEGPMRIQPEEPGGQSAAHQGLAVNAVQADGEASAPSDRVALAPAPESLSQEDQPANAAAMQSRAVPPVEGTDPVVEPIEIAAKSTPSTPDVDMDKLPVDPVAAALAIADQVGKLAAPLSESAVAGAEVARAAVPSPVTLPKISKGPKVIPASVPGVRKSKIPLLRPANLQMVAFVPTAATAPSAAITKELAPEKIAAGTRLVQLGAYDSADVARAEWDKLSARFDDYLPGKTRVIQKAQSGGKTFYRLRAMGFKDLADARRFCSALMAGKAACIPVVTR